MLRAVIIGWAQPRRSHLLRRRWMRRLLFRSFRRMMVFTRNPFVHPVLEKADTPINTGKTEGFRVFHEFLPANARNFACLGTKVELSRSPASWNQDLILEDGAPDLEEVADVIDLVGEVGTWFVSAALGVLLGSFLPWVVLSRQQRRWFDHAWA